MIKNLSSERFLSSLKLFLSSAWIFLWIFEVGIIVTFHSLILSSNEKEKVVFTIIYTYLCVVCLMRQFGLSFVWRIDADRYRNFISEMKKENQVCFTLTMRTLALSKFSITITPCCPKISNSRHTLVWITPLPVHWECTWVFPYIWRIRIFFMTEM